MLLDSSYQTPPEPIPAPLRAIEPGTFAQFSVITRLPEIGRRTRDANSFPPEIAGPFEALIDGIPEAPVRPIHAGNTGHSAPDLADWKRYVAPYLGQNWLEIPWFFAENYFFRRVVEATRFFEPGPWQGRDPYINEKRQGLQAGREAINELAVSLEATRAALRSGEEDLAQALQRYLHLQLWGNQADLSLWPMGSQHQPSHAGEDQRLSHLLVDEVLEAAVHLMDPSTSGQVDIVLDNVGMELAHDLALVDLLLGYAVVDTIRLHVKFHPTFVSDATFSDVEETVAFLAQDLQPAVHRFGERIQGYRAAGQLVLQAETFWNSPLPLWEMPAALRSELAKARLVIFKGDANYRRCLGDRHWPFTMSLGDILRYRPAPFLLLRVLKSEVAAGLAPGQPEAAAAQDAQWMTDGKWGLVQVVG